MAVLIDPAANDPGPTPDLDCPDPTDVHEPIHKRPTKRGPFSPFDEIDNRCPPDYTRKP